MSFEFLHSGTRSVRLRVPAALAPNFHFEGPQIAERNLAGDVWTIVFQKELTGSYDLEITAQVPVVKAAAAGAETHFAVTVPTIEALDVARSSGVWAIEANTETEIIFATKGMNELDSLLAPTLPNYQPRHRVIGVFAWLGSGATLAMEGVRHAPAEMLASVVDRLDLDTVVATSGFERNAATFLLRTAGAQYLEVTLPADARVLSLTVADQPVKPVGERPEVIRVPLPARSDPSAAMAVQILYEKPQADWHHSGSYEMRAPRISREHPDFAQPMAALPARGLRVLATREQRASASASRGASAGAEGAACLGAFVGEFGRAAGGAGCESGCREECSEWQTALKWRALPHRPNPCRRPGVPPPLQPPRNQRRPRRQKTTPSSRPNGGADQRHGTRS